MSRRIPVVATLVVAGAIAVMIALGMWQVQRARWKAGLFAQYAAAEKLPPITWPTVPLSRNQLPLFRHATGVCLKPIGRRAMAGENLAGEPGYALIVDCTTGAEGPGMSVEVGWSRDPNARINWSGGLVSGVIVPDRRSGMRLVAGSAPPGLAPSRPPSVDSASPVTPAIHRAYAATWFALAAIALVVYLLALRKRLRNEGAKP